MHHVLIPPGGRHVAELHIHPDAEEIVVVTAGQGEAVIKNHTTPVQQGDVAYIPPGAEQIKAAVWGSSHRAASCFVIQMPTDSPPALQVDNPSSIKYDHI